MFNKYRYMIDDNFVDTDAIKKTASDNKITVYTIPMIYRYRPDLIAYNLYKDVSMQDYLTIINDIDDSPAGYYSGRRIKVLLPNYKETV